MGILSRIKRFCFVTLRIKKYQWLSDCKNVVGKPNLYHPLLLSGKGKITFGKNVQIGVVSSPKYYSDYSYVEARTSVSEIHFGSNSAINNSFSAVAFSKISIGNNVLMGINCSISDCDGHGLEPENRNCKDPESAPVIIKDNVFLGSNVTVLKGVTIGENSVIGNNSVVTKNIPDNVIAAGNPARVIRNL